MAMTATTAVLLAIALIGLLIVIAALVERHRAKVRLNPRFRHAAYTLSLGVYCSSWTFYGAVGTSVSEGWNYLPIYLAPVLMLVFGGKFIRNLAEAVAHERASTISDFIAARFGHDPAVARIITVIALFGSVPYIALQLRSMGTAISSISGENITSLVMSVAAVVLSLFAILFGARRFEIAGRSEGLVFSIALESLIKLVALALVGGYAVYVLYDASAAEWGRLSGFSAERFSPTSLSLDTAVITLISAFAFIALPRQFYVALAEMDTPHDLPRARFGASLYLLLMAALVLPIALGGLFALPEDASPDSYVLLLPASRNAGIIVIAALLGGLSAGAAMVIVEATALATMVSNDLIFPAVLRNKSTVHAGDLGRRMLLVRRLAIIGVVALALLWAELVDPARSLASIGLVAFAAMVQFVPHLLIAVAGSGRNPFAAKASLMTGLALWLYTLALPPILPVAWLQGLSGTLIDPLRLLGIGNGSPLVHGVLWSLSANLIVFALAAAGQRSAPRLPRLVMAGRPVSTLGELATLVARFTGEERAMAAFPSALQAQSIDRSSARLAQDLVADVVGSSSARVLVASALAGGRMSFDEVTRLLDEGGQSLSFSRQLLAATFENLQSGVSVIDAQLNVVAWNTRYVDLFGYPAGLVRVGVPVADLVRYNVERGQFAGSVDDEVDKRIRHLKARRSYSSERVRPDGRVIKSVGGPMPGGGYLTSFTDISDDAAVRDELERTLDELEQRVAERTYELRQANARLADATREKTRFLAAASHDLLQPLHAARLFTSALDRNLEGNAKVLAERVDRSIVAAEALLRALLDISKLDAGGVQPSPEIVVLEPLLTDLLETMRPLADEKGLSLRAGSLAGATLTDPGLLRSVLQNLMANAVRYTVAGGVVVGVRRRGAYLRIDVIDSGVGIPADRQREIFGEFTRLGTVEVEGLGLGLAIVERIAKLLGARVEMASHEGRGSRFSVWLPAVETASGTVGKSRAGPSSGGMVMARSLRVLVVDNEADIVDATMAMLAGLGHDAVGAGDIPDALALVGECDVLLADYHLDNGEDGLALIKMARKLNPAIAVALVTAESGPALRHTISPHDIALFVKPADPAAIEAFLARISIGEIKPQ